MIDFDDNFCMETLDLRDCSKRVMDKLDPNMFDVIDEKVNNAIKAVKSGEENPLDLFL